ncbi:MAG: hypothetical protein JWM46_679 [Candidatus Kaiserbacteria bacterium]|nr:hypothetical protein [Candidatus Kaiserbacteria bacterium]
MAMQDVYRNPPRHAHKNNNGRHSRKPPASDDPIAMGTEFVEGTVKFYNRKKGFGFIKVVGGKDVFVGVFSLGQSGLPSLSDGQRVRFVIGPADKFHQGKTAAYRISIIRD